MGLTREQFMEKINLLNEKGTTFNVESEDSGSIYLSLSGCNISVTVNVSICDCEDDICGEIVMFKPHTEMEVDIDFDLVGWIEENEDGSFYLELDNDLAGVMIRPVE